MKYKGVYSELERSEMARDIERIRVRHKSQMIK